MNRITFTPIFVPTPLRRDHERRGGRDIRRWVSFRPNGVLRVLAGREPILEDGGYGWHLSVSVAKSPSVAREPCRAVSDVELETACRLVDVDLWEEEPSSALVRHAFEVADKRSSNR